MHFILLLGEYCPVISNFTKEKVKQTPPPAPPARDRMTSGLESSAPELKNTIKHTWCFALSSWDLSFVCTLGSMFLLKASASSTVTSWQVNRMMNTCGHLVVMAFWQSDKKTSLKRGQPKRFRPVALPSNSRLRGRSWMSKHSSVLVREETEWLFGRQPVGSAAIYLHNAKKYSKWEFKDSWCTSGKWK